MRSSSDARGAGAGWLAVAAVVLVGLNVRGPLAALPPVAAQLRADLAVSAGAVGLLTTLPVLCFGAAAPVASWVIARWGLRAAVLATLTGVLVGTVVRSAAGYPAAVVGTLVLGVAIAIGNIAMPVLIAEDFPAAVGVVTALYASAFNIGSTVTTALTPVVAADAGWRTALTAWSVLTVVAIAVVVRGHRDRQSDRQSDRHSDRQSDRQSDRRGEAGPRQPTATPVWRRTTTWCLVVAFGGQAFSYYGATAWLPELLGDELGLPAGPAGASASVFQVAAIAGAFGVPLVLRTTGRPRAALWLVCAGWAALPLGLPAAPQLWWVWAALAGTAQGGGITVVLVAAVARSTGTAETRATSALVQGGGYVLGALGPVVVGAAHDATDGWTAPLLVLLGSVVVLLLAGTPGVPAREPRRDSRRGSPSGSSPSGGSPYRCSS